MIAVIYFSLEGIHHCFKTRVSFLQGTGNYGKTTLRTLPMGISSLPKRGSFSPFEGLDVSDEKTPDGFRVYRG